MSGRGKIWEDVRPGTPLLVTTFARRSICQLSRH
jgi:hypothetical protein